MGAFVSSSVVNSDFSKVKIQVKIKSGSTPATLVKIENMIYDQDKKLVGSTEGYLSLTASTTGLNTEIGLQHPQLWSDVIEIFA